MSPTRWTWCSATAPGTAAPWPTRSHPCPAPGPGSGTCGWRPPPTRYGSAPPTSPTPTSWPWPPRSVTCLVVAYEGNRLAHRRTLPRLRHRADSGRHRRAGPAGRMPPVRLRRTIRHRRHRLGRHLVTAGRTTRDERIGELDEEIAVSGMRGNVLPARPRRHRSTRRRQDAAPLPRRPVSARTVGKTYTAPDGKTFRPSLFV